MEKFIVDLLNSHFIDMDKKNFFISESLSFYTSAIIIQIQVRIQSIRTLRLFCVNVY